MGDSAVVVRPRIGLLPTSCNSKTEFFKNTGMSSRMKRRRKDQGVVSQCSQRVSKRRLD